MKSKIQKILLGCSVLFLASCNGEQKSTEVKEEPAVTQTPQQQRQVTVPAFNADSAYHFVEAQVAFGPRVPNTQQHRQAGDYLVQKFKAYGAKVQEQNFEMPAYDGTRLKLRNIIATYNPEAANRILLAAHWDSRHVADKDDERQNEPILGANDGGSGVGVLLEIARILGADTAGGPRVGVDIILFDGEDYGQPENAGLPYKDNTWCLGSQYWSRNKHQANYHANYGILLDMVGAKGARFAKEGTSRQYANDVVEKVWRTASQLGYSNHFINMNSPAITDDHSYVNAWAGIRMIDIIEYNPFGNEDYFSDYHHTHQDNMEIIDRSTLKAVGQTVLHVVYQE